MATVTQPVERSDDRTLPGLPDREALMEQYRCAGQRPPGLDHYDRQIVFSHVARRLARRVRAALYADAIGPRLMPPARLPASDGQGSVGDRGGAGLEGRPVEA